LLHWNIKPIAAQYGLIQFNLANDFTPGDSGLAEVCADKGPSGGNPIQMQAEGNPIAPELEQVFSGLRILGDMEFFRHGNRFAQEFRILSMRDYFVLGKTSDECESALGIHPMGASASTP
jgi:hypothetical protein